MNKSELVEAVAKATGSSKQAAAASVDAVFDSIGSALKKGDKVSITGFGTFEVRQRAARTARNPQTGETIKVKASKSPAFRPGKGLKDTVSGAKKK
jgi:DNA-binding protein HU-beta